MPITVTATPDITKGKDIENKPVKGKLPPFGETTYDGMEIADIQMACQDSNTLHKDFEWKLHGQELNQNGLMQVSIYPSRLMGAPFPSGGTIAQTQEQTRWKRTSQ